MGLATRLGSHAAPAPAPTPTPTTATTPVAIGAISAVGALRAFHAVSAVGASLVHRVVLTVVRAVGRAVGGSQGYETVDGGARALAFGARAALVHHGGCPDGRAAVDLHLDAIFRLQHALVSPVALVALHLAVAFFTRICLLPSLATALIEVILVLTLALAAALVALAVAALAVALTRLTFALLALAAILVAQTLTALESLTFGAVMREARGAADVILGRELCLLFALDQSVAYLVLVPLEVLQLL